MLALFTESMLCPKRLDPAMQYNIPFVGNTPTATSTLDIVSGYRSIPMSPGPYAQSAFIVIVRSQVPAPFMSVRLYGFMTHTEFSLTATRPQYVYDAERGVDMIELSPAVASTNSGASVFTIAVSDRLESFSIGVFHPAVSFSVFALSPAEVSRYGINVISVAKPYLTEDAADVYITDDFEDDNV